MHTVRKMKLGRSEQLDQLAEACGEVWSDTAKWFWRTYYKKGIWLSKYDMTRWMCTRTIGGHPNPIASKDSRKAIAQNTAQGVVSCFYDALTTYREAKESMEARGQNFKPPHKQKKYYKATWNYTQIKHRDGKLRLSMGRGNEPIWIPWPHPIPRAVEIGFKDGEYELRAKYNSEKQDLPDELLRIRQPKGDEVAGIDLGEVHLAVAHLPSHTFISNGRELRSLRRLQNKEKAEFDRKIDRKEKGSRRFWKLVHAKKRRLKKIDDQINDLLHKQSTRLIEELHDAGVSTVVIGDVTGIRDDMDYGKKTNQKLHQWAFRRFTNLLTYKAKRYGMDVESVGEAYTSQTCPSCGERHKTSTRKYRCSDCGYEAHRDQVGAMNIREKYLEPESWSTGYLTPVEGVRATPTYKGTKSDRKTSSDAGVLKRTTPCISGIRYRPHMDCLVSAEEAEG